MSLNDLMGAEPESVLVLPDRSNGVVTAESYAARCFKFNDPKEAVEAQRWLVGNGIAATRTTPGAVVRLVEKMDAREAGQ